MRSRTTLTVILIGFLFGISGAAYLKDKERVDRRPSSVDSMKGKIPWVPSPAGKHLALLKVEIASPEEIPAKSDLETVINGRILVGQDLRGDLSYTWHLPEGVKLVEGTASDALPNVKKGHVIDLRITVIGFSKESQQLISLQASAARGDLILGGSAVLPSRPEDTWEAVAPEMKRSAEEQLGDNAHTRR